jgi:hypothetical protein
MQEPEADPDDIENREEGLVKKINNMGELMHEIRPLLMGLPDNQLRNFQYVQSYV